MSNHPSASTTDSGLQCATESWTRLVCVGSPLTSDPSARGPPRLPLRGWAIPHPLPPASTAPPPPPAPRTHRRRPCAVAAGRGRGRYPIQGRDRASSFGDGERGWRRTRALCGLDRGAPPPPPPVSLWRGAAGGPLVTGRGLRRARPARRLEARPFKGKGRTVSTRLADRHHLHQVPSPPPPAPDFLPPRSFCLSASSSPPLPPPPSFSSASLNP